jgi:hypothetical protein
MVDRASVCRGGGQIQLSYYEHFGSSVVRVLLELWDQSQGLATFRHWLRRKAWAYVAFVDVAIASMATMCLVNITRGDIPLDFLAYPLPVSRITT